MIQAAHPLTVTRRCELLDVARSTVYYHPTGIPSEDLALMRLLDEIHLERPFYGSRRLRDELETQGHPVNRKRVQRLVRQMGLRALYPKPRTSQPGVGHTVYPYLLRGLSIERPNQVWATDICYIPMAHGFMYLVAIMDWYSRRVLAWRVSNTFDSDCCVEALEDALTRYGPPEIFNTDQGAQFTSKAFTTVLKTHAVAISMDGKGRWVDNVFVERRWRSVKYEDVYLHAYETPASLRAGQRELVGMPIRPPASVGQPVQAAVLVAGVDLVAGFASNAELTTEAGHRLAVQQTGNESKTFFHDTTLLPGHNSLPQREKVLPMSPE